MKGLKGLLATAFLILVLAGGGCAGLPGAKAGPDASPPEKAKKTDKKKPSPEKPQAKDKQAKGKKAKAQKPAPPPPLRFSRERPFLRITLPARFRVEGGNPEEPGLLLRAWAGAAGPRLVIRARPLEAIPPPGELLRREQELLYRQLGADFAPARTLRLGGLKGKMFIYRVGRRSFLRLLLPGRGWLYVITLAPAKGQDAKQALALLDSLRLAGGGEGAPPPPRPAPALSPRQEIRNLVYSFDPPALAQARRRLRAMRKLNTRDQRLVLLQTEAVAIQALVLQRLGLKAEPVNWPRQRARTVAAWRRYRKTDSANRALGLAKLMEGEREKALHYLDRAIEIAPGQGANYLARALAGPDAVSREALARQALETGFDHPGAHLVLAWALENLKRGGEAALQYQAVLDSRPDHLPALAGLARVLMDDPRHQEQAAALWGRVLRLDPGDLQARFNLALVRLMLGQATEAQHLAEQVLAASPRDPAALNLRGLALKAQGRYQEAVQAYQAAIEADPRYAQAYYNLGALYAGKLKDKPRAYMAFKRFLEMEPQGPRADKVKEWILKSGEL